MPLGYGTFHQRCSARKLSNRPLICENNRQMQASSWNTIAMCRQFFDGKARKLVCEGKIQFPYHCSVSKSNCTSLLLFPKGKSQLHPFRPYLRYCCTGTGMLFILFSLIDSIKAIEPFAIIYQKCCRI